ncbi:coatomer beta subunit [Salpingoeca rosetta]|uniref:Coatomer subunit beta n=1 Tax=Salpingoeca rosetta (strain ATCC 50818 / BSB-021) TaxID=946362 RepID=F2TX28_SALR5|nr:coatomer beta subunit [Salpingoeca rosetta]EGD75937.1 coatomer beta subunit [Salpingoeca rosetta]|eukprot:XP_004998113.1 coatomer beta subunit [Salpingoeca rosetta]
MDNACYTLINTDEGFEPMTEMELRKALESNKVGVKAHALKTAILMLLSGEKLPSLLMTVIRFVMPCDDHLVKKLLLVFWEVVPKYGPDGKLLHEMILVCDAYRKDLVHPNEYVRGSTLRFLCKLKEPELLEPLMPSIQECLTNRHSYVRRNAVLAIYTIYKNFEHLIPDGPELIQKFLEKETDASCKRNAFMMLTTADQSRALEYLATCIDQVHTFNEILQLVIVELVHKVCRQDSAQRSKFIRVIYNLLDSSSAAVRYDAAGTLLTLSTAPTAVTAAAKCFTGLIMNESDNNVKLIVLDRLIRLKENPNNERVMQDMCMDIIKVLSAPDLTVRRKTLDLVMELVSNRNVSEVVMFLQKELAKTSSQEGFEKNSEYKQVLVRTLHQLGVRFPDVASTIVPQLMEFLSDSDEKAVASAVDVIVFVREAFERLPALRSEMLGSLLSSFSQISVAKILRATVWIIGEYANTQRDIEAAIAEIKRSLGSLPIVDTELAEAAEAEAAEEEQGSEPKVVTRTRITADGTYATESVYTSTDKKKEEKPPTRKLLLGGDFFVASAISTALTKLALKYGHTSASDADKNKLTATAMLMMVSMAHLGKTNIPEKPCPADCASHIMACVHTLASPTPELEQLFLDRCHRAFVDMLETLKSHHEHFKAKETSKVIKAQADDPITFRALRVKAEDEFMDDDDEMLLSKATGADTKEESSSKLSKVFQLSGFSDPVYAEAYVNVHQYDIHLDVLVVNQTPDTLQNLTLELATLGDLKLTEKPQSYTLGPHDFRNIKANVKVSSTETGIIFGNIVYDVSGATSDRNCVILNDIHIDIMDYITPAMCSEVEFRAMWAEFEWENKVSVRTSITDLNAYLNHIKQTTNMQCLTPDSALTGDCNFLAANLYAKSVFGEDALANLSIEKGPDGQITGHIRIRSKTQGIALSLGDKITLHQKEAQH